jgi:hypothetical protein
VDVGAIDVDVNQGMEYIGTVPTASRSRGCLQRACTCLRVGLQRPMD